MIKLERPLIIFDLETTGINLTKDRIVEIAMIKLKIDGSKLEFQSIINPDMIIPKEASDIHGITNEKVKDKPKFKDIGNKIKEFIGDSDLAGFNSNYFDVPILIEEFLRNGIDFEIENRRLIDIHQVYKRKEPRDLAAAYKFYCDKNIENAHSAMVDVSATYEVLLSQLNKYKELNNDIKMLEELSTVSKRMDSSNRITKNNEGLPIFNFGKHTGKLVKDVFKNDFNYFDWILKNDFSLDTKRVINKLKEEYSMEEKLEKLKNKMQQ